MTDYDEDPQLAAEVEYYDGIGAVILTPAERKALAEEGELLIYRKRAPVPNSEAELDAHADQFGGDSASITPPDDEDPRERLARALADKGMKVVAVHDTRPVGRIFSRTDQEEAETMELLMALADLDPGKWIEVDPMSQRKAGRFTRNLRRRGYLIKTIVHGDRSKPEVQQYRVAVSKPVNDG